VELSSANFAKPIRYELASGRYCLPPNDIAIVQQLRLIKQRHFAEQHTAGWCGAAVAFDIVGSESRCLRQKMTKSAVNSEESRKYLQQDGPAGATTKHRVNAAEVA